MAWPTDGSTSAGCACHCVEAGTGPLVVLLHGPGVLVRLAAQIPALADAGYRVVAPDLRGYSTSAKPSRCATTDPGCWSRT